MSEKPTSIEEPNEHSQSEADSSYTNLLESSVNMSVEEQFYHRNFLCIIKTSFLGHRCGYVVLPENHSLAGNIDILQTINVHGGITFARQFTDGYVVGFDCAHMRDGVDPDILEKYGTTYLSKCKQQDLKYWTSADVKAELEKFVDSIDELAAT